MNTMEKKSLVFETKPEFITVDLISDDVVRVEINGDIAVLVNFDTDVKLHTKGNFTIAAEDGIDLVTNESPICLDSIESGIHLNSREGKLIKDLPESKEFLEKMKQEQKRIVGIGTTADQRNKMLKDRVTILELQVKELLNARSL